MAPMDYLEAPASTSLSCVTSQKSKDLIYTAVEKPEITPNLIWSEHLSRTVQDFVYKLLS
jgi:hypothetical protein